MLGIAATASFVSENTRNVSTFVAACNTSSPAQGGDDVTPVKPLPGCVSQGICDFATTRYNNATRSITIPGCPYPTTSTTYAQACAYTPYYAPTYQQVQASQRVADRELGRCCDR